MNKHYKIPMAWGLLHGVNDWVAGYMIMHYSQQYSLETSSLVLIVYTILGFGGQLPVGMWLDKHKNITPFINGSVFFLVAGILCFWMNGLAGIVVAGLSSAFLHVTGGCICLHINNGKISPLGVFTAPGVLGLTLGIACGGLSAWWLALAIVAVFLILMTFNIRLSVKDKAVAPAWPAPVEHLIGGHDWVMIAILLTVTLRSLLYEVISLFSHHWQSGLLTVGIAAFAGKMIGGMLADKIGWKRWVYITLPLAFVFLQFGGDNLLMLGFGISCLQSSVPISLMLMSRSIPQFPATATALTLGTGIAVAALFLFIIDSVQIRQIWFGVPGLIAGIAIILAVAFVLMRRKKLWRAHP